MSRGESVKEWAERFYNGSQWRDTRDAFLRSRFYLCERCGGVAKIAHHKTYLTPQNIGDPGVSLCWDNLEALCQDCHNKEHHKTGAPDLRYRFDRNGNIVYSPHSSKKF